MRYKRIVFDATSSPPRDPQAAALMVRRIDSRRSLAFIGLGVFLGGWAALFYGVLLVYKDSLPATIAVIPPAILASIVAVVFIENCKQVTRARRLLTLGSSTRPTGLAWVVYPFAVQAEHSDLRGWCLPVGIPGDVGRLVAIEMLDKYRDWNRRQERTVLLKSAASDEEPPSYIKIPSSISAAELKASSLFRLETPRGTDYGFCVPALGFFPVQQ